MLHGRLESLYLPKMLTHICRQNHVYDQRSAFPEEKRRLTRYRNLKKRLTSNNRKKHGCWRIARKKRIAGNSVILLIHTKAFRK